MGVAAHASATMPDLTRRRPADCSDPRLDRRRLLTLGSGAALALLAGCSGNGGGDGGGGYGGGGGGTDGGDGGTDGGDDGTTGTFRLLISDQPVAIDEFDALEVTLDRARIFRAGADTDDGADEDAQTDTTTEAADDETDQETGTQTTTGIADSEEDDDDSEDDAGDRGFEILDLGGRTVDLTEVVGDRAVSVFEGGLPAGEYTKVELETSAG